MNTYHHPYAAPAATGQTTPGVAGDCWRQGRLLVVQTDGVLPERCVKCNAPATMDKLRRFVWHASGWYLLLLLNPVIYAIAALIVQKQTRLEVGLCADHRRRRRHFHLGAAAFFAGALLSCFAAATSAPASGALWLPLALLLFLAAIVVAAFGARILVPVHMDADLVHFKGCGKDFLSSLPSRL